MLSHRWLKGYPNVCTWVPWASIFKMLATECFRHADASRHISFDSPRRADSNETLPDSGGHLPSEVSPFFSLLTSIAMRTARNIHHSIPLDWRTPTHPVQMLPDRWLKGYPNICTWDPRASTFKLWATVCYRHADPSRPIPLDPPRRADSNETLPDSGRHLRAEISAFFILLTSIAMRTPRNLYHSIPLDQRIPMHPVSMLSNRWLKGYTNICTLVPQASTFKMLASECYRHADASRPIPFDSPRQADSNDTLTDPGGDLLSEIWALFILLPAIAMLTLWSLYHSIPLGERTPMRPFPTLADICPLRYLPFSPCCPL